MADTVRVSQQYIEVITIGSTAANTTRVSQQYIEVIRSEADVALNLTAGRGRVNVVTGART